MIGQAQVTDPLMAALRTERIGHAYLFSGPRGCGKTSSARILARCLNCAEGPTDTPCGVCDSCKELGRDGGGSLDVVEIDAASHGGVDDARELRERAVFAPARDRYKIFIIDEAHMVTSGGFNALLKIVEEPPPHVKFIFATTEPEKVIGTIRSRTHHYPFRLIAPNALLEYVQQLCDSEGVSVDEGVLPLVVRAGGGSVRDTLSILDQLIAGSESGSVTLERATGLLGYTSTELIDEIVVALGSNSAADAFAATDRVVQTGQDPRRFAEDLLERLRDLIVISATTVQGAGAVFRGVPDDQLQRMFEQSQLFAPGQLSRIADTVSHTLDTMVGATAPRLHLELMVARALRPTNSGGVQGQPEQTKSHAQAKPAQAPPSSAGAQAAPLPQQAPQAPAAKPETRQAEPSEATSNATDFISTMRSARDFLNSDSSGASRAPMVPLGGHPPQNLENPTGPESASAPSAAATTENTTSVSFAELQDIWPDLLEELREGNIEAWQSVSGVRPLDLQGEMLTIGLASKAELEAFKSAGAGPLREAISGALGVNVKYAPKSIPSDATPLATARESAVPAPEEPSPPVEEATAEHAPAEQMPAEQVPAEKTPVEEAQPEQTPTEQIDVVAETSSQPTQQPELARYGEAVVREVLGARFIEERPLPEGFER